MNDSENILHLNENMQFSSRITDYYDEEAHMHSYYEIFVVLSGTIEHCIDSQIYRLQAGDACLILPNVSHRFIRKGECSHRDFLISQDSFKAVSDFIDPNAFRLFCENNFLSFKMSKQTILAIEEKISIFFESAENAERKNYEKILSFEIISSIYSYLKFSPQNTNSFKGKCTSFITEHCTEPDVLKKTCESLGYTYIYFCRKFKQVFHMTPTQYANSLKVKNAAYLLVCSDYTINQCCETMGFWSMPYFIKLFKEHFGMTPSEYKRANLNKLSATSTPPEFTQN